jgi:hypothetical protein
LPGHETIEHAMIKFFAIAILSILSLSRVACHSNTQKKSPPVKTPHFACLPADIKLDYVSAYGKKEITIQEKLVELKADCVNGKLVDGNKREIRFFKISCFGNPPFNYDEIRRREHDEIEKLKLNYTVIVMECNPMMQ